MKKIFNHCFILFAACLLIASCKKEGEMLTIKDGVFAPTLAASTSDLVLTTTMDNDTVIHFTWPAADFGKQPAITYTLQLTQASDTTAWANAKTFAAGNNTLSYGFIGKDLNNLLNAMALPTGTASVIAVRIRSDVNQYNGSVSAVPSVYSNTITLNVTPYGLSLYIPGAYQGWDPSAAPLLNPVAGRPGLYEAYINITGTGTQYFKYTSAPDWNHINYGDGGNHTFNTDGAAGGLYVDDGGYYEVTADFNTNTWSTTKTTWGIIGDASPGGWNNDTQMTYDPTTQTWKVTLNMVKNGSFKFRANGQWSIDFGVDNSGNLVYADNPFFGYTAGLNNLSVPEDGNYTITLDLHTSGKYLYDLHKN